MIELLIFAAGVATGLLLLALPYHRAVSDREVLQAVKDSLALDREKLSNRITVLKGDNEALAKEREDLKREIGRMKAEAVADKMSQPAKVADGAIAFTPARDSKGKFLPKPKAAKPPKAKAAKPKPVAPIGGTNCPPKSHALAGGKGGTLLKP